MTDGRQQTDGQTEKPKPSLSYDTFACFSGLITNCDKSETQQCVTNTRSHVSTLNFVDDLVTLATL